MFINPKNTPSPSTKLAMQTGTFSESLGSVCRKIHGACNDLKWKWIFDKPKAEKDNIRKKKKIITHRDVLPARMALAGPISGGND